VQAVAQTPAALAMILEEDATHSAAAQEVLPKKPRNSAARAVVDVGDVPCAIRPIPSHRELAVDDGVLPAAHVLGKAAELEQKLARVGARRRRTGEQPRRRPASLSEWSKKYEAHPARVSVPFRTVPVTIWWPSR
jgi:hypothetical protein